MLIHTPNKKTKQGAKGARVLLKTLEPNKERHIMKVLFLAISLFTFSLNIQAETLACISKGHVFIKDGEMESAIYNVLNAGDPRKHPEDINLFHFNKSSSEFISDLNFRGSKEKFTSIGATGKGWRIYLGADEHPLVVTVNKNKMEIHVLADDGSITLYGCTH